MEVNPMIETPSAIPHPPAPLSREQILQTTSRCLRDFGYDATTIRKIAGMLGCAVGSIYRYFTDKRELLSLVTQQTLEPVAAMAQAGGESIEPSVRMYHQLVTHAPETYRLMFWLACPEPAGAPGMPAPGGAAAKLPAVVQQVIDGWSARLDPATARRVWAMLHGFVLLGRSAEETLAAVRTVTAAGETPAPLAGGEGPRESSDDAPRVVVVASEPGRAMPGRAAAGPQPAIRHAETAAPQTDDVCLL
jgi:AcrR family transcriptional regulator